MSRSKKNTPASISSKSDTAFDARWAQRLIPGLAFVVPLLFLSNLYDTYDLPKLALVAIVNVVVLWLWLVAAVRRGSLTIYSSKLDIPLGLFLVVTLASCFYSLDRALSFWGAYKTYIFGWVPMLEFAVLYWLTMQYVSRALVQRVRWAVLLSGALVGVYAGLQYVGIEIISGIPAATGLRVWSSLGNPVYVGALCMMAIAVALGAWSAGTGIFAFLSAMGLVISLTRSAWIGTAVAAGFFAWKKPQVFRQKYGATALGVAFTVLLALSLPAVRSRIQVLVSTKESSSAARLQGWIGGLRIWQRYPWLGSGPDTFFQAFRPVRPFRYVSLVGPTVTQGHAHNEIIQVASTEGSLGVLAYLWVLVVLSAGVWRCADDENSAALGFGAALLALWIQNQFNFSSVATSAWAAVFAAIIFRPTDIKVENTLSTKKVILKIRSPLVLAFVLMSITSASIWGLYRIIRPLRADWDFRQGKSYVQGEQYTTALEFFREAVRLNGRIPNYEIELANTARMSGNWEEAWSLAIDQTRRHPSDPDAWNNLGVAAMWLTQLAGKDHWQDAKSAFDRALELDPYFVEAWANVAKYHHLRGNIEDEKKCWRHVLEIYPHHEMARRVLGLP